MKLFFTTLMIAGAITFSSKSVHAQCYSAVQLDGINQYMHSPFTNYTFNTFTLEMWVNSQSFAQNEHYISLSQNSYLILGGWGPYAYDTWADGLSPISISSGATPPINTWHHIAFVYDGSNQILYIDGVVVMTTPTSGSVTNSGTYNSGLVIGARWNQTEQYTPSAFDDVRIWNVARTPTELTNNMTINLSGSEPGLLAYYRFEDGAGSSTVSDLTGNGNTLTLVNMDPMTDWITSSSPVGMGSAQSVDVQSICDSYTWLDGNTYTSSNNTATYTYAGGAANGCDSTVLLDLTINSSSASTDMLTTCISHTWIDGNTYTASNNVATYTYAGGAANGCDSIVSLDLTINTVDNTVTTAGLDLTANAAGATYQWVNCDSSFAHIVGETNQLYTATENGNYAVIVTGTNGCTDTSACIAVTTASLKDVGLVNEIALSPNPTNGEFSISSGGYSGEVTVRVLDITGELIFESTENLGPNASIDIDLSESANGVYVVNVSGNNESHSIRVVKN